MSAGAGPMLERVVAGGVACWTDPVLRREQGVLVCFSERSGGVSGAPYEGLNLAGHVGDDADAVDTNRGELLEALGLAGLRDNLTCAEQVHGDLVAHVGPDLAGAGAYAAGGRAPVRAADALACGLPDVPLLLCFADCVPVVLVAPGPVVAVVHAGWRGALAGLPGRAVRSLVASVEDAGAVRAYVGAHIGPCHYAVEDEIMSHFVNAFGTVARADSGGLDLGAVVTVSLTLAGVDPCNIARLGACTAEATDRFFSYRAEGGLTGRHGALACILSP